MHPKHPILWKPNNKKEDLYRPTQENRNPHFAIVCLFLTQSWPEWPQYLLNPSDSCPAPIVCKITIEKGPSKAKILCLLPDTGSVPSDHHNGPTCQSNDAPLLQAFIFLVFLKKRGIQSLIIHQGYLGTIDDFPPNLSPLDFLSTVPDYERWLEQWWIVIGSVSHCIIDQKQHRINQTSGSMFQRRIWRQFISWSILDNMKNKLQMDATCLMVAGQIYRQTIWLSIPANPPKWAFGLVWASERSY